jgi:sodium transport system ATP-binding protein
VIKADHLIKTFVRNEKKNRKMEINAVDDISLTVEEGEIVGILGPNGAGKTTLLRMMSRLMKPTSGQVSIRMGETEMTDEIEVKRHIGYLSNNTKLYGRLSSRELLQMLGTIYGIPEQTVEERIRQISEVLSMDAFLDNRIEKLSTGQTQRASIARCLVHDPQVYIFDEPTLGLDIISSASIIDFMKRERNRGKTVLYSTHYMEEAEYLCDRIVMIHRGKIISEGTPAELKERTKKDSLRDVFSGLILEERVGTLQDAADGSYEQPGGIKGGRA